MLYISSDESFIPLAFMSDSKAEISDGISIPSSARRVEEIKNMARKNDLT
jgi:hypothetical protein